MLPFKTIFATFDSSFEIPLIESFTFEFVDTEILAYLPTLTVTDETKKRFNYKFISKLNIFLYFGETSNISIVFEIFYLYKRGTTYVVPLYIFYIYLIN